MIPNKFGKNIVFLLLLFFCAFLAFYGLYRADNKYTDALPGGAGYNVLQTDTEKVSFLVDGWEYYPGELLSPEDLADGVTAKEYTYAGQYPNFSAHLDSPFGTATYRLILQNQGELKELSLYLPELLCAGRCYINGELADENGSLTPYRPLVRDGVLNFFADESTEIIIQCANYTHYYSGMYYPPAVGSPGAVARLLVSRTIVYGALCFCALATALSNLALWAVGRRKSDRLTLWLGLLCLAFALRVCYPFLRSLGAPLVRPLYALEDFCAGVVLLCAILLAGELSGLCRTAFHRKAALPGAAGPVRGQRGVSAFHPTIRARFNQCLRYTDFSLEAAGGALPAGSGPFGRERRRDAGSLAALHHGALRRVHGRRGADGEPL